MKDLFLAEPNEKYQKSFEAYVRAYEKMGDAFYVPKYKEALDCFEGYLLDLRNLSEGIGVPQDWVATSTFWLIDTNEVVGVVRIRHHEVECAGHIGYDISPEHRNRGYGSLILKLALEKVADMGLLEVIVTCNIENEASRKIIEKNNGVLLGTVFDEVEGESLYRYSIRCGV